MNRKLFSKADTLVDKILFSQCIKFSKLLTLFLNDVRTGIILSDFAKQLRCKNADVPDLYCTLHGAVSVHAALTLNQNAKAKERKLRSFQNLNIRSCKNSTHRMVLPMGLCAI